MHNIFTCVCLFIIQNIAVHLVTKFYFTGNVNEMQAEDYVNIHAANVFEMLSLLHIQDTEDAENFSLKVDHLVTRPKDTKEKKNNFSRPAEGKCIFLTSEFLARRDKGKDFMVTKMSEVKN